MSGLSKETREFLMAAGLSAISLPIAVSMRPEMEEEILKFNEVATAQLGRKLLDEDDGDIIAKIIDLTAKRILFSVDAIDNDEGSEEIE